MTRARAAETEGGVPPNAKIVLGTLILVAAVANLNLSVANVALPSIGASFDASQTRSTSSRWATPSAWPPRCCGSEPWATATDASR